jgi:hypothetical protein
MGLVHGPLVPLARGFLWWDNMVIFFMKIIWWLEYSANPYSDYW